MSRLIVYTDGGCRRKRGAWAFLIGEESQSGKILGECTSNIAELTAIREALLFTTGPIEIVTDSQYSIGALSLGWKRNKNIELLKSIDKILRGRDVIFTYVAAHSGIPGNEICDSLCTFLLK